jgi:hypothetical protein
VNLVYYAHSYRKPDAPVIEFFSALMRSEGLIASLDPPSDRLNSAKPERHLRSTDGMVAVLTAREGGVSQYILYEISLCLRAGKPILVFVEDTLPDGLISSRVLQRRFSRKGLLRQVRDHRHAVQSLRSYIGEQPPPEYQPSSERRTCLLSGVDDLPQEERERVQAQLMQRGYLPRILSGTTRECLYETSLQEMMNTAQLAIAFVDSNRNRAEFFLGALRTSFVPTILLSHDPTFHFYEGVPREYQTRIVDISNHDSVRTTIDEEISIAEEEYVDLENQEQVKLYSQLLFSEVTRAGDYTQSLRNIFVEELNVTGDQFTNYGQAGAMGTGATGSINNYASVWNQAKNDIDLNSLAVELAQLRAALRQKAQSVDEDKAVLAVSEAESEAKSGNGPKVLEKLAAAGNWALTVAKDIGVKLAAEAILKSIGM